MVTESKHRLATNNIFTTIVVSLLTAKFGLCDSGYIILYPQPRSATVGYLSFTGQSGKNSPCYLVLHQTRGLQNVILYQGWPNYGGPHLACQPV